MQYPYDIKQEADAFQGAMIGGEALALALALAVAMITQNGYTVLEVAALVNVTNKLIDNWVQEFKQVNE
jgi:hypothetical protein